MRIETSCAIQESILNGTDLKRSTSMTFLDEFLVFEYLCELAEEEKSLALLLSKKADSNSADLAENSGKNSLGIKWSAASIALRQIPAE